MIQYQLQPDAPHLRLDLAGTLSRHEVEQTLDPLPNDLSPLPNGFVALIVYPDLRRIEEDAVGPLFYAATHLLHAQPSRCIFVDGGHSPHPGLREYIKRIGTDEQVVFVETEADAVPHIEQSGRPRSSAPGPST